MLRRVTSNPVFVRSARLGSCGPSPFPSSSSALLRSRPYGTTNDSGPVRDAPSTDMGGPTANQRLPADTIAQLTGMPAEHLRRRVRIYKGARTSTQSADASARQWHIRFVGAERWQNPLMGWASSRDPVDNLTLNFDSKEGAVEFAETHGMHYTVEEPLDKVENEDMLQRPSYATNFKFKAPTKSPWDDL